MWYFRCQYSIRLRGCQIAEKRASRHQAPTSETASARHSHITPICLTGEKWYNTPMESRPAAVLNILVTNDDGVDAPGLLALKLALQPLGNTIVIAPDHNWSAAGHTKTLFRPLTIRGVHLADGSPAMCTDGAPSDCVALATLGYIPQTLDLIVAGVNHGPNLGDDITYSGTVAAAMEGSLAGIPSMAISLDDYDSAAPHYETAAAVAALLARTLFARGLDSDVLLNVNVPNVPLDEIAEVRITRLGKRIYRDVLVEKPDAANGSVYWIGGDRPTGVPDEGTDIRALAECVVSVTPIHLDLTDHSTIQRLEGWRLSGELPASAPNP
jgi:5'-nucleotidase